MRGGLNLVRLSGPSPSTALRERASRRLRTTWRRTSASAGSTRVPCTAPLRGRPWNGEWTRPTGRRSQLWRGPVEIDLVDGVRVDGVDATRAIRTASVDAAVSAVAANPEVRTELVRRQRKWVEEHDGGVVEGRDIGTVVLPDADLKVYLTAAPNERARRRAQERSDRRTVEQVETDLKRRDHLDSTRTDSPLPAPGQATDALVVDSTHKSPASILEEVLRCLKSR